MQKKIVISIFVLILSLTLVVACQEDQTDDTIEIGYNQWAENIAVSNMWKILLEDQGYDVELVDVEKAVLFSGVAQGDLDIGMEVWIPYTDRYYIDEYGDDFDIQDTWYEGADLGLVVPEYMEVDSIDELSEYRDELDGEIIGIDAGASIMDMTQDTIEEYDLDFNLIDSSEAGMMSELDNRYSDEEPIVVTLWSPHWAFAEYDLKYLDDPVLSYGEADNIVFITRDNFENDQEEVLNWMNDWEMDDESLGELMSVIKELDDPVEGAQQWIDDNEELVEEWLNE
ncbi:glycine betaine ABC transporter substrate-binding protein [Natranaerobius trueperi]|uniref:glycine betaine ABC transporter substrate-binding protein n=1 Tax=Natranaerobius trueperi TaxID=759412 RepID=UPI00197C2154|nr:glycine betaine ABC transporter substrate-binding protein [Natranaerobius trueperi]